MAAFNRKVPIKRAIKEENGQNIWSFRKIAVPLQPQIAPVYLNA